mmetsp:Transcript_8969/g.12997  ORF Transcript_8969/g.12997 Transcript_8969/m.12997 type:complete len:80 (+) Transcript_8969:115-354(+)
MMATAHAKRVFNLPKDQKKPKAKSITRLHFENACLCRVCIRFLLLLPCVNFMLRCDSCFTKGYIIRTTERKVDHKALLR